LNNVFGFYLLNRTISPIEIIPDSIESKFETSHVSFLGNSKFNLNFENKNVFRVKYKTKLLDLDFFNRKTKSELNVNKENFYYIDFKNILNVYGCTIGYKNDYSVGLDFYDKGRIGYSLQIHKSFGHKVLQNLMLQFKSAHTHIDYNLDYGIASNENINFIKSKIYNFSYMIANNFYKVNITYKNKKFEDKELNEVILNDMYNKDMVFNMKLSLNENFLVDTYLKKFDNQVTLNFLNHEGDYYYKLNMFKDRFFFNRISLIYLKNNYKLSGGLYLSDTKAFASSRIKPYELSNDLYDFFLAPIVNGLDSIKIEQDGLYGSSEGRFKNYFLKLTFYAGSTILNVKNRLSTPPFNPIVPIIKANQNEYKYDSLNLSVYSSLSFRRFKINFILAKVFILKTYNLNLDSYEKLKNFLGLNLQGNLIYEF